MWQIWQKKINMFVLAYVFFTYQPLMFDLSAARSGITSFHSWNNLQIRNTVPLATIPISEYFYTDGATNVFKWATKTINYSKFVTDIWSNMALRVVNNNALSLKSSASKVMMRLSLSARTSSLMLVLSAKKIFLKIFVPLVLFHDLCQNNKSIAIIANAV